MQPQSNRIISKSSKIRYDYGAYLFILPLITVMTVFMLYPALTTFYYGFTKWNGISEPQWMGLKSFVRLFTDKSFGAAIKNSLTLALYIPLWTVAPLLIAALIRKKTFGSGFFRLLVLIPFVISPAILGMLFGVIFRDEGPVNTVLRELGADFLVVSWLANPRVVIHVIAVITIYKFFGFGVILYLGAMGKIAESLYDSAEIDGANWFQTFVVVTVPGIKYTIEFFIVLGFITYFARMFPLIFTLTRGGPGYASFVPEFGVYYQAFENQNLGYSATWAIIMYLLTFLIIIMQISLMRKGDE